MGLSRAGQAAKDSYTSSQMSFFSRDLSVIVGGPWRQVGRRASVTRKFGEALKLKSANLSHFVTEGTETRGVSDEFLEGVD